MTDGALYPWRTSSSASRPYRLVKALPLKIPLYEQTLEQPEFPDRQPVAEDPSTLSALLSSNKIIPLIIEII